MTEAPHAASIPIAERYAEKVPTFWLVTSLIRALYKREPDRIDRFDPDEMVAFVGDGSPSDFDLEEEARYAAEVIDPEDDVYADDDAVDDDEASDEDRGTADGYDDIGTIWYYSGDAQSGMCLCIHQFDLDEVGYDGLTFILAPRATVEGAFQRIAASKDSHLFDVLPEGVFAPLYGCGDALRRYIEPFFSGANLPLPLVPPPEDQQEDDGWDYASLNPEED